MTAATVPLLRLLQTADTSFPSGAFAFSSGLETLVSEGRVTDADDVQAVLTTQVCRAGPSSIACSCTRPSPPRRRPTGCFEIDRDCHVHNSADRLADAARRVGRSLLSVHARIGTPGVAAYRAAIAGPEARDATGYEPVVQGLIGAGLGLSLVQAETGALHSVVMGVVSAAVRLGRLGALQAQGVLAGITPSMAAALDGPVPDHPGAFAPLAEIAALRRPDTQASLFAT